MGRRIVQLVRGGAAGSGPRGIGPDSMNLRRSPSVDHIDRFQFVGEWGGFVEILLFYGKLRGRE